MMKILITLIVIFFAITDCFAQQNIYNAITEISNKISKRDCNGAETHARNSLTPPTLFTALGIIQIDCRRDKSSAIQFFNLAARDNEPLAIETLIKLGEPIPAISQFQSNQISSTLNLPPPPPLPTPTQQPQRIIIQQPAQFVIPLGNPNACIQDGGPIYCPNHPSTKLR